MTMSLIAAALAIASVIRPQMVLVAAFVLAGEYLAALIAAALAYGLPWLPPESASDRAVRAHNVVWRDRYSPIMDAKAAARVLDLTGNPAPADIRQAHHKLMARVHPDKGGSPGLAAIVNEARDVLLRKGV